MMAWFLLRWLIRLLLMQCNRSKIVIIKMSGGNWLRFRHRLAPPSCQVHAQGVVDNPVHWQPPGLRGLAQGDIDIRFQPCGERYLPHADMISDDIGMICAMAGKMGGDPCEASDEWECTATTPPYTLGGYPVF
jgi:hypothetical protein